MDDEKSMTKKSHALFENRYSGKDSRDRPGCNSNNLFEKARRFGATGDATRNCQRFI